MRFKEYLIRITEANVIRHLTHLEDLVFLQGYQGAKKSLSFLSDVFNEMNKNKLTKNPLVIQQKVDGAPSIVAGWNPENGKFFVGTKSVFNKIPKLNYTNEDITKNHSSPGLVKKLKEGLK